MNGDPLDTRDFDETATAGGASLPLPQAPPPPSSAPTAHAPLPPPGPIASSSIASPPVPSPSIPPSVVAPLPKPKPPILAERVEDGWRTERVLIDRAEDEKGFYVTLVPPTRNPLSIYVSQAALDGMIAIATSGAEPGKLWKALADIPLERPLPSRSLEEELRVILTSFANELRQRW